jgi:hypothetical protein
MDQTPIYALISCSFLFWRFDFLSHRDGDMVKSDLIQMASTKLHQRDSCGFERKDQERKAEPQIFVGMIGPRQVSSVAKKVHPS